MMRRVIAAFVVIVSACAGSWACTGGGDGGGDEGDPAMPLVDQIVPAMAAVDAVLGSPQRYFEVNATAQLVNLFVAVDDASAAVAYVFLDGELQAPAPAQQASGSTFGADAVDFEPDAVLGHLDEELPESLPRVFSIIAGAGGIVQYGVLVDSQSGGRLDIVVDGSGNVLEVDPG